MSTNFYPTIDENYLTPIRAVIAQLTLNPNYLDDAPYTDAVKAVLKKLIGQHVVEAKALSLDDLEAEVADLLKTTKEMSLEGSDPKDKAMIARVIGQLLEKCIALKERVYSMKSVSDFQKKVIDVFEDLLDGPTRTKVIEKLGQQS